MTKSPLCSSTLYPDHKLLSKLSHGELYEVVGERSLESVTLEYVYNSLKLKSIDWIKLDTQGTDLRIIKSLPAHILETISVIDVEPGLYGSYIGEDEFAPIDLYLRSHGFWLAALEVNNIYRMSSSLRRRVNHLSREMKPNPKWVNARYIRDVSYAPFVEKATSLDYFRLSYLAALQGWLGYAYEILDGYANMIKDEAIQQKIIRAKKMIVENIK